MSSSSHPLALVLLASVLAGASLVFAPPLFALLLPLILGSAGLAVVVRVLGGDEQPRLMRWTFLSLGAHIAIGGIFLLSRQVLLYLAPDGLTYHESALSIVQKWTVDGDFATAPISGGKEGFVYLLAWLYRVLGPYPIAGIVTNAVLSAAVVPIASDTTRRLFGAPAARAAAPVLVLLPGFSSGHLRSCREAGVLLLLALIANFAVRLSERAGFMALLGLGVSIPLLFTFRGHIALVALCDRCSGRLAGPTAALRRG